MLTRGCQLARALGVLAAGSACGCAGSEARAPAPVAPHVAAPAVHVTASAAQPSAAAAQTDPSAAAPVTAAPVLATTSVLRADYTFSLDADFTVMAVSVCMRGHAPAVFSYGSQDATPYLQHTRLLSPGAERPLLVRDGLIVLDGVPDDACIAYDIDVTAAVSGGDWMLADQSGHTLVASVELFLWRPRVTMSALAASARFSLPAGMRASLPWPRTQDAEGHDVYTLEPSAFEFTGHVAFGPFDEKRIEVPGSVLEVAELEGIPVHARPWIEDWITKAATAVAGELGHFPLPRVQIVLMPVAMPGLAFQFGHTGRSGGASIIYFVPTGITRDALRNDWVVIHELCHLMHPFVEREDAWLSEGLATYLQEAVRARAGLITPELAYKHLYEGSLYGEDAQGSLADEAHRMSYAHNYKRVYWGGAVLAMMADTELRRRSDGRMTLSMLLGEIGRDPEQLLRARSGSDLMAQMDQLAGVPVWHELANEYVTGPKFPALGALYEQLGVSPQGTAVVSKQPAPLAELRQALMTQRVLGSGAALPKRQ